MQTKHRTVFRSKNILLLVPVTILFFCGCISYQMIKSVEGTPVASPNGIVLVGKTTLGDALSLFGVPDQVLELEGKNLIIYERILYRENALTIGIPVMGEIGGPSADLSARGGLARYDTLALFFTPDDILCNIVYDKGSLSPYLKTLLSDTEKNP
jgi:hypothetical protein